ncbi:hypothetical protein ABZ345_31920 [Lentzea sp. NPDC005914]|uniref:hypothetical protein n=1 Tax=Lentzea sp. NPDC005914 TaxID=3154572 RepID=UPI0033DF78E2
MARKVAGGIRGPEYRYYAIVRSGWTKEDPFAVARERVDSDGTSWVETYTRDLRWEASSRLTAIRAGRSDDDAELITADVVERFIAGMKKSVELKEQG